MESWREMAQSGAEINNLGHGRVDALRFRGLLWCFATGNINSCGVVWAGRQTRPSLAGPKPGPMITHATGAHVLNMK